MNLNIEYPRSEFFLLHRKNCSDVYSYNSLQLIFLVLPVFNFIVMFWLHIMFLNKTNINIIFSCDELMADPPDSCKEEHNFLEKYIFIIKTTIEYHH
jgi:hypothetical protein